MERTRYALVGQVERRRIGSGLVSELPQTGNDGLNAGVQWRQPDTPWSAAYRHNEATSRTISFRLSDNVPSVSKCEFLLLGGGVCSDHQMWFIVGVGSTTLWSLPDQGIAGCDKIFGCYYVRRIEAAGEYVLTVILLQCSEFVAGQFIEIL